jgi:hypothetical protein
LFIEFRWSGLYFNDLIKFLKFENSSTIYANDDELKKLYPNCSIFLKGVKMPDHAAAQILVILAKIKTKNHRV